MAELSPLHMVRKKAFGFPRCGLLAFHAAETPDELLTDTRTSAASTNQVVSAYVLSVDDPSLTQFCVLLKTVLFGIAYETLA